MVLYGLRTSDRVYLTPDDIVFWNTRELKFHAVETLCAILLFATCVFVVVRAGSAEKAFDLESG